jgi:RNA polymerase sigma-70 factor (ECF subfamily)
MAVDPPAYAIVVNAEMVLSAPPVAAPAMPEGELVARARGGDRSAWDELARQYRRPAYLLALQLLGDPDDALDVAQDALLRFFTKLHRFRDERPVRPWLLAIVRNRARDLLRRKRVRRAEPLLSDEETYRPELVDPGDGPEDDFAQRQLRRELWQRLAAMPAAHREILVLRDYQDLSYAEIAQVLTIPIGTVMSRLHRARATLARLLARAPGGHDGVPSHSGRSAP